MSLCGAVHATSTLNGHNAVHELTRMHQGLNATCWADARLWLTASYQQVRATNVCDRVHLLVYRGSGMP